MSFYYAKDVKSVLLPITLISWFVGMGVIEYPIGHRRTILSILYSSTLCTFQLTCAILLSLKVEQERWQINFRLVDVIYGAYYGSYVLISAIVIIVSIVCNKKRRRCITELEDINEIMKGMGVVRSYKRFLISQIWQFGSLVVMTILIGSTLYFNTISAKENVKEWQTLYDWFLIQYAHLISTVNEIMFCNFNEMITVCFEDLNALLKSVVVKHSCDSHNTENNLVQTGIFLQDKWKIELLYSIRKIYTRLARVAQQWNQNNAVVILTMVVFSTWMFVLHIYTMYTILSYGGIRSLLTTHFIQACVLTIFLSYKLFVTVRSAVSLTTEAHRTCGIALHLYPITSLRSEVRTFSMQLIRNPLHLTLHGLCSLDYSLLQQIFVAVATYSVMFIQNMGLPQFNIPKQ